MDFSERAQREDQLVNQCMGEIIRVRLLGQVVEIPRIVQLSQTRKNIGI